MNPAPPLLRIGAFARKTGVSVKTIRFYADEGLLPPAHVSDNGYRWFSDDDRVRLGVIRALRAADVDLHAIQRLLVGTTSADDVIRLQLDATERQMRQLRRRQHVLQTALASASDGADTLVRLEALSKLDALEWTTMLQHQTRAAMGDVPVDDAWMRDLLHTAFADLPDDLDDVQWQALCELVELLHDDEFATAMQASARPFWEQAIRFDAEVWTAGMNDVMGQAIHCVDAGPPPSSASSQKAAQALLHLWARACGRRRSKALARELLALLDDHDDRLEHVWTLVALIRQQPPPPHTAAFRHLMQALQVWVGPECRRHP